MTIYASLLACNAQYLKCIVLQYVILQSQVSHFDFSRCELHFFLVESLDEVKTLFQRLSCDV